MKIAIHQPNFMPWLGYFKKIKDSDVFVILDEVKGSKNSFLNRNIFSSNQCKNTFWLGIPISKKEYKNKIKDINAIDKKWIKKHIKYFELEHKNTIEIDFLSSIIDVYREYLNKDVINICSFNKSLIDAVCEALGIKTKTILSSEIKEINWNLKKQNLLIDIILSLGGDVYISGKGADNYQDIEKYSENGINVLYNNPYKEEMIVNEEVVSAVDLILRLGKCKVKQMILA